RVALIACWWLAPFWIALWVTGKNPKGIEFEFGTWSALLAFTPFYLTIWGALTVFPYKLIIRFREINNAT
ncbi:MAG: hypothetical protein ACK4Z8_15625, partial [Novosphingobium sp.]